jgi:hypothetical protein
MIVPLSKLTSATFMVACRRPLAIRYHWAGRSVLCAGKDCPACLLRTPKIIYYFAAHYQKQLRVFEACPSMVNLIERLAGTLYLESWNGLIIDARRTNNKSPWILSKTGHRPDATVDVPEGEIALSVANIYRLPAPESYETAQKWLDRVAPLQSRVLQQCQLI